MDVQTVVEFFVSKRKNIFAIYGGYKYHFVNKNKNNTTRWVCRVRTCHASILTDNKDPHYQVIKFKRHLCSIDPRIADKLVKYRKLEPPYSFLNNLQSSHSLPTSYSEDINRNVLQEVAEKDQVSQFSYSIMSTSKGPGRALPIPEYRNLFK